ncbi:hypothetical protein GCM10027184_67280 [Saccharothrix stipae]
MQANHPAAGVQGRGGQAGGQRDHGGERSWGRPSGSGGSPQPAPPRSGASDSGAPTRARPPDPSARARPAEPVRQNPSGPSPGSGGPFLSVSVRPEWLGAGGSRAGGPGRLSRGTGWLPASLFQPTFQVLNNGVLVNDLIEIHPIVHRVAT